MKSRLKLMFCTMALSSGMNAYAAAEAQQACLEADDGQSQACFLEVLDQGRAQLYTTESAATDLALNEILTQWNLEFQVISDEAYTEKFRSLQATSYLVRKGQIDIYDFESAGNCNFISQSWRGISDCAVARQPSRPPDVRDFVFAPKGSSVAGLIQHGSTCGSGIYAHLGGIGYDLSESKSLRPIRRCS